MKNARLIGSKISNKLIVFSCPSCCNAFTSCFFSVCKKIMSIGIFKTTESRTETCFLEGADGMAKVMALTFELL